MKRVLLLASTTGYQIRMFGEAAERLGVKLLFATDRCDQLDDPWWDSAIPIRFHQEGQSVDAIAAALGTSPVEGIVAVGDRPSVIASHVARVLDLPGHPPEAAITARDKRLTRETLRAAGLPVPTLHILTIDADPSSLLPHLSWPVVVKPAALSGSRGVIRADNPAEFVTAFARIQRLLRSPDVRVMRDAACDAILVESFIAGREYAVEGLLDDGALRVLAIFDKPDPLDGPFFEETIYVTPSRASAAEQDAICRAIAAATRAMGLYHGPIHAECRVNADGVFVLEVAARPIGGLCARVLRFAGAGGSVIGLEELIMRHALRQATAEWQRETCAAGVMMIPIPTAGVYRRVDGVEAAMRVPGIEDVQITAKTDQHLVPLPEGSSYLGFIFARGERPEDVEAALRESHARLTFTIERAIALV